jgi:hypothetical protein
MAGTLPQSWPERCQLCQYDGPPTQRVARCTAGHVEPTTAQRKTKCRHHLTAAEARERGADEGSPCRLPANVPAIVRHTLSGRTAQAHGADDGQAAAPELARAWDLIPELADGPAALPLREDEDAGTCPRCGKPRLAEPGRTITVCLPCGQLAPYPLVDQWYQANQPAASGAAVVPRRSPGAERRARERDASDMKSRGLAMVGRMLKDGGISRVFAERLRTYERQIEREDDIGELRAIAVELLAESPERNSGPDFATMRDYWAWLTGPGRYEAAAEDEDEWPDEDDGPQIITGRVMPPRPLPRGPVPLPVAAMPGPFGDRLPLHVIAALAQMPIADAQRYVQHGRTAP